MIKAIVKEVSERNLVLIHFIDSKPNLRGSNFTKFIEKNIEVFEKLQIPIWKRKIVLCPQPFSGIEVTFKQLSRFEILSELVNCRKF